MAGGIHISKHVGLSAGTVAISDIVERIRAQLEALDASVIPPIYEPYEDGFRYIVVDGVDEQKFDLFYRATKLAYAEVVAARLDVPFPLQRMKRLWEELIGKLEADPRWKRQGKVFGSE